MSLAGVTGRTPERTSPAPTVKEHRSLKRLQVSCRYSLTTFQRLYLVFSDESGWCWFIPMRGKTSLGIVEQQDIANLKKSQMPPENRTARSHYMAELDLAPSVKALLGNATLIEDDGPAIRSASDFSYHADSYAGPNYRIVGDAGAFIDPFFSSGVHLAMASGLSAAASILSARRGEITEKEAVEWHTSRTAVSYTRFVCHHLTPLDIIKLTLIFL